MATDNSGDLSAFIQFANERLQAGANWSLDQALSHWYATNMTDEEANELDEMVQEALDDIDAGAQFTPIEEVFAELEAKYGLKPTRRQP